MKKEKEKKMHVQKKIHWDTITQNLKKHGKRRINICKIKQKSYTNNKN